PRPRSRFAGMVRCRAFQALRAAAGATDRVQRGLDEGDRQGFAAQIAVRRPGGRRGDCGGTGLQYSASRRPKPGTLSVMPRVRKASQYVATLTSISGLPRACSISFELRLHDHTDLGAIGEGIEAADISLHVLPLELGRFDR